MQRSCGAERLVELAGKDATKEFNSAEHSDTAKPMIENCLVGEYMAVGLYAFYRPCASEYVCVTDAYTKLSTYLALDDM